MKHLVIGQRQKAPNFSAFHWSPFRNHEGSTLTDFRISRSPSESDDRFYLSIYEGRLNSSEPDQEAGAAEP